MCMVCGKVYCPPSCPAYDADFDEQVCGWCEECGVPLYAWGLTVCVFCETEKEKQHGIECGSRENESGITKSGGLAAGTAGNG